MPNSDLERLPISEEEACPPDVLSDFDTPTNRVPIPDLDFDPDPELAAEGWERRFMADPARTRETIQLYTELGFEVRMETIQPTELSVVCGDCRLATCNAYVTVYTRKLQQT
ncbi:MAG: hypothetical protein ACE5GO_07285 [Anaerolineales bacterium]